MNTTNMKDKVRTMEYTRVKPLEMVIEELDGMGLSIIDMDILRESLEEAGWSGNAVVIEK